MSASADPRFTSLVQPHFAALYRTALRLTRRRHDAEDLVQEVCLRACVRLGELENVANTRAWLMRALYHLFIDTARRSRLRLRFAALVGAGPNLAGAQLLAVVDELVAEAALQDSLRVLGVVDTTSQSADPRPEDLLRPVDRVEQYSRLLERADAPAAPPFVKLALERARADLSSVEIAAAEQRYRERRAAGER